MEAALLPARIGDTVTACERTGVPQFLGFLTEAEVSVAIGVLRSLPARYEFSGGHSDAERQYLSVLPEWCEQPVYPITALTFSFRAVDKLSHRDFLGSLMALGIARETVGDILVESGRAVVFVNRDIAKYIMGETCKVGNVGVTVTEGATEPLPQASKKVSCTDTVASLRLDCVIAAVFGMSRTAAGQAISDGLVFINSLCVAKPTRTVAAGDKINLRGKGRFQIEAADERSRKGRIILKYNKYI